MFCESKSGSQRDPDLTFRVESVSHSNCVVIQKDHVLFRLLVSRVRVARVAGFFFPRVVSTTRL